MAPQSSDVARLLNEAASATTFSEQQRLVGEAEDARTQIAATAAHEREVDLASAVVADRLTPVRVHEHHTASTDWLGEIDTAPASDAERSMVAQGSVWYAQRPEMVKQHPDELAQQALGMAQRLAGQFGSGADAAEKAFLDHVGALHARDVNAGLIHLAASGLAQVGEEGNPAQGPGVQGAPTDLGLPGELTSSERAPAMRDLADNTSGGSVSDTSWPDPLQLPQADVDAANGDSGTARTHSHAASRRVAQDLSHGQFAQDLGRKFFGPQHDEGLQDWSDRDPIINDHGKHLYQVNTWHETGEDGHPKMFGHEMRSHFPDVHDDVEQAAWEDHASRHGVPQSQVQVSPAQRITPQGPVGRGTKTYTATREGSQMPQQHTAACPECSGCPACGGTRRVAVRARTAASGLDQIDQTVDPHDNAKATPYPEDIAFPWEMPNDSGQAIQETEQQLAQREKMKGASRRDVAARAAHQAAQAAYRQVMAGQDDSGWLGDMGAGGVRPGMQDTGNPGTTYPGNLADQDPVYGQGGDNGNQPLKPYGADEANDYTNNPGMNIQPGAPMQYDQAGRGNQVGQPTASRRPSDDDPQVQQALAFARQRRALLDG